MLGSVVLYDAFEPVKFRVVLTSIADEQLLLELLRERFDLRIKYPLHVLQDQLATRGCVGWIKLNRLP